MRYMAKVMICKDLNSLKKYNPTSCRENVKEIVIIPRSQHGQVYVAQGLSKSAHFSLGPNGVNALKEIFKMKGVKILHHKGTNKLEGQCASNFVDGNGIYVQTSSANPNLRSDVEVEYQSKMISLSKKLWPSLLMVSCFMFNENQQFWNSPYNNNFIIIERHFG